MQSVNFFKDFTDILCTV